MPCKCGPKTEEYIKSVTTPNGTVSLHVKITSECKEVAEAKEFCAAVYTIQNLKDSKEGQIVEFDAGPDDKTRFSPAIGPGQQGVAESAKKSGECAQKKEGRLIWRGGAAGSPDQEFGKIEICILS